MDKKVGYVNLAVYGTLRKTSINHYLLEREDVKLIGYGILKDWAYCNHFLTIKPVKNAFVVVEVYEVPYEVMVGPIDRLEGYPSFYDRKLVNVTVVDAYYTEFIKKLTNRQTNGVTVDAYVYYIPNISSHEFSYSHYRHEHEILVPVYGGIGGE